MHTDTELEQYLQTVASGTYLHVACCDIPRGWETEFEISERELDLRTRVPHILDYIAWCSCGEAAWILFDPTSRAFFTRQPGWNFDPFVGGTGRGWNCGGTPAEEHGQWLFECPTTDERITQLKWINERHSKMITRGTLRC
jgi:hypothetical protein